MKKNQHLHKYKYQDLSRGEHPYHVYVCVKPDCRHFLRVELIEGKQAECDRCGEAYIIRVARLRHGSRWVVKPHCNECTRTPDRIKRKKAKMTESINSLMDSILPKF